LELEGWFVEQEMRLTAKDKDKFVYEEEQQSTSSMNQTTSK